MNEQIEGFLYERGADVVRFVDISGLPANLTQGFATAVLFCMALSRDFVIAALDIETLEHDEFVEKEHETDTVADMLAEYIQEQGYRAYSQSERSNEQSGNYCEETQACTLPHKTIARLAGLGYIGKNNLLVTEEYGCAFSMCTVLTDAPVTTESHVPVPSGCGGCDICRQVCPSGAIVGSEWSESTGREGVVDVFKCKCALKCMVNCPKTLRYARQVESAE